jgi:SEC-C motif-containing protein
MEKCPCGKDLDFDACCKPLLDGTRENRTAEECMRSRYSAYVKGRIDYIVKTIHPKERSKFDKDKIREWSQGSEWKGLEILETEGGGETDEKGVVEFVAEYTTGGEDVRHHERAYFEKVKGTWYFKDGETPKKVPYVRETPKPGRNDPCPCGSGKKYKKCCM